MMGVETVLTAVTRDLDAYSVAVIKTMEAVLRSAVMSQEVSICGEICLKFTGKTPGGSLIQSLFNVKNAVI